jgi:hypothetical protein
MTTRSQCSRLIEAPDVYPGFHVYADEADGRSARIFIPRMRNGWQFPRGWGDTLASRQTGRTYLTSPKLLHRTSAYDEALGIVRTRHRNRIVISARDTFTSRHNWLEERERVLTDITWLYVLVPLDGRIGPGVGWELAFTRFHNPALTVRALKALPLAGGTALSVGPTGDGYPIAGTWPDFTDYHSWDAAPALARVLFQPPALSLVSSAGAVSADRTSPRQNSVSEDHPNEGEPAA